MLVPPRMQGSCRNHIVCTVMHRDLRYRRMTLQVRTGERFNRYRVVRCAAVSPTRMRVPLDSRKLGMPNSGAAFCLPWAAPDASSGRRTDSRACASAFEQRTAAGKGGCRVFSEGAHARGVAQVVVREDPQRCFHGTHRSMHADKSG